MAGSRPFLARAAPGVRSLAPYLPGKPISELERELGLVDTIKLASNENPLGPPPASVAAANAALATVGLYPDGAAYALKAALAAHLGVGIDQVTVGNGSNDILVLLAETFLAPGCNAVFAEHAFAIYALATQATGADSRIARARPADGPQPRGHDLEALAALIDDATRLVFIANPNNPTGTWNTADELDRFMRSVPDAVIVVLDEAYAEYVTVAGYPDAGDFLRRYPNLVVTRTFSKAYGLAGLRVGYALSDPEVAGLLNRVRQPFNVGSAGQAAAVAALAATDHVTRSRALNRDGLALLAAGLTDFGWSVPPSAGNFVLADTGGDAMRWYEALLRRGIIVRPVANYGLPNHLRITVGLPAHHDRLLTTLRECRREVAA